GALRQAAVAELDGDDAAEYGGVWRSERHVESRLGRATLHSTHYARVAGQTRGEPMQHGRPVAILGGVRIPFCRQNTAYADVGNLGMSVRTLGALVEK